MCEIADFLAPFASVTTVSSIPIMPPSPSPVFLHRSPALFIRSPPGPDTSVIAFCNDVLPLYRATADAVRTALSLKKESPLPVPDIAVERNTLSPFESAFISTSSLCIGEYMVRLGKQSASNPFKVSLSTKAGPGSLSKLSPFDTTSSSHSSAQNPAPSVGVSPILPVNLFVIPPVLVAQATTPSVSRATAPQVP